MVELTLGKGVIATNNPINKKGYAKTSVLGCGLGWKLRDIFITLEIGAILAV